MDSYKRVCRSCATDGSFVQEKIMSNTDAWRIDHTGIGVSDIQRSARFYDAALGALGLRPVVRITKAFKPAGSGVDRDLGGVGYGVAYPIFWIDVFHPHGAKQHTAFRARSREEVEAFHRAALSSGGQDNGKPGLREGGYPPGYYAAFVLDPDGNNIEAVFREI
jgi:catechol 2,3-dioxygenase-like lactoylglutathione lyase family enzyme